VQFSEVPALSVPQLEAISRAAIVREYKKDLTSLTISFVYEKDPFGHDPGGPCRHDRHDQGSTPGIGKVQPNG